MIQVLSINQEAFETICYVEIKQQEKETGEHNSPQRDIVPVIPEVHALADKTEESTFDKPDLHELTAAQRAETNVSSWQQRSAP